MNSIKANHAFLWNQADGVMTDLNDWAADGWVLTSASAINGNGDIVGTGVLNGVAHGFVLTNGLISAPPAAQIEQTVQVTQNEQSVSAIQNDQVAPVNKRKGKRSSR